MSTPSAKAHTSFSQGGSWGNSLVLLQRLPGPLTGWQATAQIWTYPKKKKKGEGVREERKEKAESALNKSTLSSRLGSCMLSQ